jgi:hypothetical protein
MDHYVENGRRGLSMLLLLVVVVFVVVAEEYDQWVKMFDLKMVNLVFLFWDLL